MATDIFIPYLFDMTLVYTILGTILVYVSLKCGLVKNSGAYFEFFETCNVPLAIVNEKQYIEYQNAQYEKQKIVIYSGRNVHVKLSGFLQRS